MKKTKFLKILNGTLPGDDSKYLKDDVTRKVYFEKLSMDGLDEMHEYSTNKKLYEYLEYEPFKDKNDTSNYLQNLIKGEFNESGERTAMCWFVRRIKDDRLIGTARLVNIDYKRQSVSWGYGIDPELWGEGYILEIQELLKEYIFEILQLKRLWGIAMIDNKRTIRTLLGTGCKEEGILRQYYRDYRGEYFDAWIYSMLSEDYFDNNSIKAQIPKRSNINLEKIIKIVSSELKDEAINQKSNMDSVSSWDSLSHLSVIMAIEEKLGLTFSTSEIAKAISIERIYNILKAKKNN